jgi:general secretion pathway protein A
MYLNFFHLRQEPFQITPDPAFLYLSPSHKEALASIIYGIQNRKGFIAITGEVGVGKTTIVRSYLASSHRRKVKPIYFFNANITFENFVKTVCRELGVQTASNDVHGMIDQLHQALIDEYEQRHNLVLIVDEAQNMPVETLEQLRMLSNLETSKEKLIQIVLVGQPELNEKLNRSELRQLKQRIAIRATINPLTKRESLSYIKRRLSEVAIEDCEIFTAGALKRIIRHARGIPRLLNILCDNALIAGYGYQKKPVTSRIAREVIDDFEGRPRAKHWWWRLAPIASLVVLTGLVMATPHRDVILYTAKCTLLGVSGQTSDARYDTEVDRVFFPQKSEQMQAEKGENLALQGEPENFLTERPVVHGPFFSSESPLSKEIIAAATTVSAGRSPSGEIASASPPPLTETETFITQEMPEESPKFSVPSNQSADAKVVATAIAQLLGNVPFKAVPASLDGNATTAISVPKSWPEQQIGGAVQIEKTLYPVTRTIKEGDNLSSLCLNVYGFSNAGLLQWVKGYNPRIDDLNHILIGDEIVFPEIPSEMSESLRQSPTGAARGTNDDSAFMRMISND